MYKPVKRICRVCSYDLTGLHETAECPECGNTVEVADDHVYNRTLNRFARGIYLINMCGSMIGAYLCFRAVRHSSNSFDGFVVLGLFYFFSTLGALLAILQLSTHTSGDVNKNYKLINVIGTLAMIQFVLLTASCPVLLHLAND